MTGEWGEHASIGRFPEWHEISPNQPIRQGDVLAETEGSSDPWAALLVVITADCDIVNSKHGGSLTCVPILDVEDYLLKFRFDKPREKVMSQLIQECLTTYRRSVITQDAPEISPERLRAWIGEAEVEAISDSLELTGEVEKRFGSLAHAAKAILAGNPVSVGEAATVLARGRVALNWSKVELGDASAEIARNVAAGIESLPGDALFLNQISHVHTSGYIAYLRRVVEVKEGFVATKATGFQNATHNRVSRLASPYVYALSQQFAAVFSAIGLPSEYENARTALIRKLSDGDGIQ